ncbi:hypothetical protein SAY86_021803 [Trapa natans]|uniref:Uncharacterized protein n=1 Tax=Trapa natans TaxID=22666 RepID=A0AAN7RKH8_TRANT|nr:hypothetical protein SAY86_021803 [Trapa natans]
MAGAGEPQIKGLHLKIPLLFLGREDTFKKPSTDLCRLPSSPSVTSLWSKARLSSISVSWDSRLLLEFGSPSPINSRRNFGLH